MSDVKLPIVGSVPKGWLYAVLGIGGVAGVYVVMRRRSLAAAAPADTSGTADTSGLGDSYTGDLSALSGDPYGDSGFLGDVGDSGGLGLGTVSFPSMPGPGSFASNAQWAQYAEEQLAGIGDAATLSAALGKYLTGGAVTSDQASLIDQSISIAGYPPVAGPGNYPPGIKMTAGGGGGGQGGGGGTKSPKPKRHVASGTESLAAVAKSRHTTALHIISVTNSAPLSAANKSKFQKYVRGGTAKRMPAGLVYYTSN